MRLLLCSHAAWRHTGYGAPVLPWARQMKKHGHEVAVLAVEERGPGIMEYKGLPHYLPAISPYGEDVVRPVCDHWKADVVVSLLDVWPLELQGYADSGRPWIAWSPIDQTPPQRGTVARLEGARLALSFSEWGAAALNLKAPDLKARSMPLGVDMEAFAPDPNARGQMCAALDIPEDVFIVGLVGSNLLGDRKALANNILGFCKFARQGTNPDAYLILWTTLKGWVNIPALLDGIGSAGAQVKVVSQWELAYGGATEKLAAFYNGLDVLLHASAAEGFGLPMIEAMACGTPVIGANNTSMPELVPERVGRLVGDTTREWTRLDGWWYRPTPSGIASALSEMREELRSIGTKRPYLGDCRGWARSFDWTIVGERWNEVLNSL